MLFAQSFSDNKSKVAKAKTRYFNGPVLITKQIVISLHFDKWFYMAKNTKQFEKCASICVSRLKVHPNPVKICQIILCIILYFLCSFNPRSVIQQLLPKYKKGVEWGFLKACILCKCFSPFLVCLLLEECKKGGTRVLLPLLLQQQEEKCIFFTYGIECKILLLPLKGPKS